MSKNLLLFISFVFMTAAAIGREARSITCNFDGDNAGRIYTIHMATGMGTTFQLPDGWEIKDFIVSDTKFFFGQSNGKIATVKPLADGKETSCIIYTENDQLYCFYCVCDDSGNVDLMVRIDQHNEMFFNDRVRSEASRLAHDQTAIIETRARKDADEEVEKARQNLIFGLNSAYRVKDAFFGIDKVSDDGTMTYIRLAKSQERPAVFVAEKDKDKDLEPVKYVDAGDHYEVHRVIQGREKLYLKLGDKTAEISK